MYKSRMRRSIKTLGLGLSAGLLSSLAVGACGGGGGDSADDGQCLSNERYFEEMVWAPILGNTCVSCHNEGGAAKDSNFILQQAEWGPTYLEQNLEVFTTLAKLEFEGTPWILLKPSNQIGHGGGTVIEQDSEQYAALQEMVTRIANPVVCADEDNRQEQFFDGVKLLDEVATLRKATLSLVGRLPTDEEEERVRDGGFDALDVVLDEVLREDEFYVRLKEIYNDHFLTDRYYPGTQALDLLDQDTYPNVYWFETLPEDELEVARRLSNRSVAREAVELVAHVVRNELPYSEILTADYTMVSHQSARVYGVNVDVPADYETFVPVKVPGVPHAGVLTMPVWLNRFPTTPTNRNRHRSRMVYDFFLALDVEGLGDRPVDASNIADHNPEMNTDPCRLCHSVVDPVAGAFQNWDDQGRYRPPENGWYPEMRPPGFGDKQMPASEYARGVQWVAREIVQDPRFAVSAVNIMFKGLSGQEPLKEPTDPTANGYLEKIQAARMQRAIFNEIGSKFVEDGYNLKTVVKEIVKTPYYRAYDAEGLDEARQLELADLGTGRLLIPEQLNRKLVAVTGYPWRPNIDAEDYLTDLNQYRIYYGGIDSDDVVERMTAPNGIMANVAKRMANEMSCLAVPQDFGKPPDDRVMFPFVEPNFEPEDANGFEVPAAAAAIRENIRHLHARMLGQYLDSNDPAINRTYELFLDVWKDGQSGITAGEYGTNIPGPCQATSDYWTGEPFDEARAIVNDPQYTIRAWMAVMSYMMQDWAFLHE
jgi:hypothetical protein